MIGAVPLLLLYACVHLSLLLRAIVYVLTTVTDLYSLPDSDTTGT